MRKIVFLNFIFNYVFTWECTWEYSASGGQKRTLELEVIVSCLQSCWKPNSGPLPKQQTFLTAELRV